MYNNATQHVVDDPIVMFIERQGIDKFCSVLFRLCNSRNPETTFDFLTNQQFCCIFQFADTGTLPTSLQHWQTEMSNGWPQHNGMFIPSPTLHHVAHVVITRSDFDDKINT